MTALLLVLLALQAPVDEGTLVIREDTVEIAREGFRLTALRTAGGGGNRWTLASTARSNRTRPVVVLDPIVEPGPASNPASLGANAAAPPAPPRPPGTFASGGFAPP